MSSSKRIIARAAVTGALVCAYYAFDWQYLRLLVRSTLVALLGLLGQPCIPFDAGSGLHFVTEHGVVFTVTANCTYIDLFLTIAAFCWNPRSHVGMNAARLVVLAGAILIVNIGRLMAAFYLSEKEVSWALAHNLPDTALHILTIATAVLYALKTDGGETIAGQT